MTPDLRAVADSQMGVVSRAQARDAGLTERQLKTALRPGGAWAVVRRGVYAERWEWEAADEARKHLMRVVAVTLSAREPYVLSHSSSAVVHGLSCRPWWRELVHVSHPRVQGGRTEGGVKHHPAYVPPGQIEVVQGLRVTSCERAAVDIAREHGLEDGVIACDEVLRRGGSRAQLSRVLEQMWSWPYVTTAREAVALADPGAENMAESLGRLLVRELGFGVPATQVWIEDGRRRARVDMLLHGHIFEVDGRVKFIGADRGGLAEDPVDALWREKKREDWLRSLGFGISRIIWDDFLGTARRAALARLTREYLATRSGRRPKAAS
jgi:hypothetical protein